MGTIRHSKHTFYFELPGKGKAIDFLEQKGLLGEISPAFKFGGDRVLCSRVQNFTLNSRATNGLWLYLGNPVPPSNIEAPLQEGVWLEEVGQDLALTMDPPYQPDYYLIFSPTPPISQKISYDGSKEQE